jgi:hypothetical protein
MTTVVATNSEYVVAAIMSGERQVPFFAKGLGKKGLFGGEKQRCRPGLPRHVPPRDATIRAGRIGILLLFSSFYHVLIGFISLVSVVVGGGWWIATVVTAHLGYHCSVYFERSRYLHANESRV